MELKYTLEYHHLVLEEDLPKITKTEKNKIKRAIEEKLCFEPELYGKPLRRSLKNYRSLRVGDYRVIFKISGNVVKIFVIQHRSVVYKNHNIRSL